MYRLHPTADETADFCSLLSPSNADEHARLAAEWGRRDRCDGRRWRLTGPKILSVRAAGVEHTWVVDALQNIDKQLILPKHDSTQCRLETGVRKLRIIWQQRDSRNDVQSGASSYPLMFQRCGADVYFNDVGALLENKTYHSRWHAALLCRNI